MLFVLGCPVGVYVIHARVSRKGLLFVLGCPAGVYVVRATTSRRVYVVRVRMSRRSL